MAIVQSDVAKGKQTVAYPAYAGHVAVQSVDISSPATLVAGDILEVAVLPALARVVDLTVASDNVGFSGHVGLMDGEVGSTDTARTCGVEFFANSAINGVKRLATASAFRVGSADHDRSIGIRVNSGTPAAGTITLIVTYAAS